MDELVKSESFSQNAWVKNTLQSIDWNFDYGRFKSNENGVGFNPRKHHWWPATFIPEIPHTLIEILSRKNSVVYDPFGGIGTTFFQALVLGRVPLTTENSYVAYQYMKSVYELFMTDIDLVELQSSVLDRLKQFDVSKNYEKKAPQRIKVEKLRPWYENNTFNELMFLSSMELQAESEVESDLIKSVISGMLNTCNSQKKGWGCIADNMLPNPKEIRYVNAIKLFNQRITKLLKDVGKNKETYHLNENKQVLDGHPIPILNVDVRKSNDIVPDGIVDLIVTSPPYPNMTDYITSQRLSYYYYGKQIEQLRDFPDFLSEIGARSKRNKKGALDRYFEEMKQVNEVVLRKVKSGGFACYVLPLFNKSNMSNRDRMLIIDKVLLDVEDHGFDRVVELERILPSIRRSHNTKWAKLDREKMIVFRKI